MPSPTRRPSGARVLGIIATFGLVSAACVSAAPAAQHISAGCDRSRSVALTFDDGPNPPYTEQILDLLDAAGAKATFFIEGQASVADRAAVQREVADGMAVGSHSYSHDPELPNFSDSDFDGDLALAEEAVSLATGFRPALYRAPYGRQTTRMLRRLRAKGYTSIGWDIDSTDWSDTTADAVVNQVLSQAHAGAIILMHDGGLGGGNPDRSITIAALPRILSGLKADGYALVTVPELTGAQLQQTGKVAKKAPCTGS